MGAFRYCLALVVVMGVPGAFAFWFSIHPFVNFWRKVGVRSTYTFHVGLVLALALLIYRFRDTVLRVQFGAQPVLFTAGIAAYMLAFAVLVQRRKGLGMKQLVGLPELAPQRPDNRLVTSGIYSRVRHPRYLELLLFLLGHALLTNYLAVYVTLVACLAGFPVLIWMEEKELRERFGKDHESYCARVPRWIPRL